MELIFVGDIHGNFGYLADIAKRAPMDAVVIQVGDFGYWPDKVDEWKAFSINRPIHFIEGNHEHYPSIPKFENQVVELWPNLYRIPRGKVLEFNGKRVGFCGGAGSIDKAFRTPMVDWFPDEAVGDDDVDRLVGNASGQKIDLLVTHCPPISMINNHLKIFRPSEKVKFGVSEDWVDYSQIQIQRLWERLGFPPIICGHMHHSVDWNVSIPNNICMVSQVKILDINEIYTITI